MVLEATSLRSECQHGQVLVFLASTRPPSCCGLTWQSEGSGAQGTLNETGSGHCDSATELFPECHLLGVTQLWGKVTVLRWGCGWVGGCSRYGPGLPQKLGGETR